jgi:glycerophosphoryl diester phosphodiesterase
MNSWPYPIIFAHRGGGTQAPENTLAAIKFGYQAGYRAVEFDVMLTQDLIPILMHDPSFGRTIKGVGQVANTPSTELLTMDAGAWHSAAFKGETPPLFNDVAAFCATNAIAMNIEIKPAPGHDHATGLVVAKSLALAIQQFPIFKEAALQPLVSSFSVQALTAFREVDTQTRCGLLLSTLRPDWPTIVQQLNAYSLHCNWRLVDAALVKQVKDLDLKLFCYTVNDVQTANQLLALGIDGFCTDELTRFNPSAQSAQTLAAIITKP